MDCAIFFSSVLFKLVTLTVYINKIVIQIRRFSKVKVAREESPTRSKYVAVTTVFLMNHANVISETTRRCTIRNPNPSDVAGPSQSAKHELPPCKSTLKDRQPQLKMPVGSLSPYATCNAAQFLILAQAYHSIFLNEQDVRLIGTLRAPPELSNF